MKLRALLVVLIAISAVWGQDTRSSISGRILDPQGGAVAGATVTVRNVDTGVALTYQTNGSGFYEASLLLPGTYDISVEMTGFKRSVQSKFNVPVSSRMDASMTLEVGGVTETISVTAEAALLETSSVSQGRVLDNKSVMELPIMGNSAMLLVKLAPGIQTGGVNNYLALHSNAGGSDYSVSGNIGGNSWSLDGSPNQGPGRRNAYLPYTDAVAEFKVETNNFDASIGQTSGAAITMISKSGSNELHGTATWQHWQQRWQGTPFFVKQNYFRNIAAAEAAGNTARANELRAQDKQPTGRSNNWGVSGGGPVWIPKVINGKNKLFWYFTYNAFKDVKVEDPSTFNRTVPSLNAREGNFADMLSLPNGTRFAVHDPASITRDPARPNNFIRTPFAGNIIPRSRFVNPAYDTIMSFYPKPNVALAANQDPVNNYLASQTPFNWDYYAFSQRMDYQLSDKWRMFGRWSVNNFGPEDRGDWTYETARGLNLGGLVRNNKGGNFDVVYTQSATTLWDLNIAINQFREGSIQPKAREYKPSDLGLPAYLDQKAGDLAQLPQMAVAGFTTISPGGLSTWTRTRQMTAKLEMTHIRGNHTVRAALDNRNQFRTGGGGGNTSGNFGFNQQYVRRNDDSFTPANDLGLGWAAFILGVPNSATVATNDTYALYNPYYGWFVQDSWRVTRKLTLNLGLRMEYEQGATERYSRAIVDFDPALTVPIAAGAQAAYARTPVPELAATQFRVIGGSRYAGAGGNSRRLLKNELMYLPRIGAAYALDNKTVIRAGYGRFFDTINVLNFGPNQFGYSRNTSSIISTDFGQTWGLFPANASPANFKSPLVDPFPVRADGTRFDVPTGSALGAMAEAGRGFDYSGFDQPHARQQRWQVGFQRQLGASMVFTAAYAGTHSDRISLQTRLDKLPEKYWATGLTRNNTIATNLNGNVPNPFFIGNFNRSDFPAEVWTDMNTNAFFTAAMVPKHRLLREFPNQNSGNGLRDTNDYGYYTKSHELYLTFDKRFSKGWNMSLSYTGMRLKEADFLSNEFDIKPTERTSNDGRPHRFTGTGIYELPFGRGKALLGNPSRAVNYVVGGWQVAATYEFQPGPLLDFGSTIFYYGNDLNEINNVSRNWDKWFNTANFETVAARGASSFHARTFPTRIEGLRRDKTSQWNANVSKNIPLTERVNMQLRLAALNVQNRSQMNAPSTDPFSTNFGRVTSQTAAINRWFEAQARITF